jgi:1,4-alpha-glucan branching enzyme
MTTTAPDPGTGLIRYDPWLEPYRSRLRERHALYASALGRLESTGGLTGSVSTGHHYFGLNRGEFHGKPGVWYREWAPGAVQLRLIGDFNGWDRNADPMVRDAFGIWSLFLPDDRYADRLTHGSKVKVHVIAEHSAMDRIPAYIRRVVQEPDHSFVGVYWSPPQPFAFHHRSPQPAKGLRIYEAHVGMATEHERVGTYAEFTRDVLPRVARLGYNTIQLMAVMEHPYYGSFGYHVSSLFAASSRSGTPEELKELIDTAHGLGIVVLLDVVHSHAVKNTNEGLSGFDGTDYQYFHAGGRGEHTAWDSKLYDYSKFEVQRLLLSNLRFWLEEYRFDGFRFDGVTSMLYLDHGMGKGFSSYDDYFGGNVDADAVTYLQLANDLIHRVCPHAVTIAEDVSGMVGLARPTSDGGMGFDYRLAMGVPDYWIKLLKERKDDDWNMAEIFHTLMNRRHGEGHVGYAESHDQAMVGDKTIAFWLMDQEMYWSMSKDRHSDVVERGIALHKLIRLVTFSLAGEAYLNFMGNEFGHPEWIDFPRQGNGYSYKYARRQWGLADNATLKYEFLQAFDIAMQRLDERFNLLADPFIESLFQHEDDKVLVYRRGPLVFAFNFHPTKSFDGYRIPVPDADDYRPVLNSDDWQFGGQGRSANEVTYMWQKFGYGGRPQSIQLYLPSRTVQVLAPV